MSFCFIRRDDIRRDDIRRVDIRRVYIRPVDIRSVYIRRDDIRRVAVEPGLRTVVVLWDLLRACGLFRDDYARHYMYSMGPNIIDLFGQKCKIFQIRDDRGRHIAFTKLLTLARPRGGF